MYEGENDNNLNDDNYEEDVKQEGNEDFNMISSWKYDIFK